MGLSEEFERSAYGEAGSIHGRKHYRAYVFKARLRTWSKTLFWLGVIVFVVYSLKLS